MECPMWCHVARSNGSRETNLINILYHNTCRNICVYTFKSLRSLKVCSRDNICWTIGDDLIVTNSSWDKNSVIWPRKVDRDTHPIIDWWIKIDICLLYILLINSFGQIVWMRIFININKRGVSIKPLSLQAAVSNIADVPSSSRPNQRPEIITISQSEPRAAGLSSSPAAYKAHERLAMANESPVSLSPGHTQPIGVQYSGHVTCLNQ